MLHEALTPLEAVALAVRSEVESINLYAKLTEIVRNPQVKELLTELAAEEEKHRTGLLAVYREMLQGEEPVLPVSDGRRKSWNLAPGVDFLDVMARARDKEIASEAFYRDAAARVRDEKTRVFLLELAESERKHAVALQRQVEKLERDPYWFDRVAAEDHRGVHEGP
jgi:rubrerythrin